MTVKNCPHCGSRPESLRRQDYWACGSMISDKNWRTIKCHKREITALKARIKMLEEANI